MAPHKRMPEFTSEAEEAKWLFEHRHELDDYMDAIAEEQALEVKADLAKLRRSEAISLRLPASDLVRAKALAECKHMGYQTYLKSLIREGLDRDEQTQLRAIAVLLVRDIDRLRGVVSQGTGAADVDAGLLQHLQMMADIVGKPDLGHDSQLAV